MTPPIAAAPGIRLLEIPPVAPLGSIERSTGQRVARATTDSGGRVICLLLPAQGLHPAEVAGVRMDLLDSGGRVIWAQSQPVDSFQHPRQLFLDLGSACWKAERYTLRLTIHPSPSALVHEPEVREFPFEVRLKTP